MCGFNVGDAVKLKRVSEDDKLCGRYIGEIGIFQNLYNYGISNEKDSAEIRFDKVEGYIIYLEDLELVVPANIRTALLAHGIENNEELIKDLKRIT